jgi:hypothetical protein
MRCFVRWDFFCFCVGGRKNKINSLELHHSINKAPIQSIYYFIVNIQFFFIKLNFLTINTKGFSVKSTTHKNKVVSGGYIFCFYLLISLGIGALTLRLNIYAPAVWLCHFIPSAIEKSCLFICFHTVSSALGYYCYAHFGAFNIQIEESQTFFNLQTFG